MKVWEGRCVECRQSVRSTVRPALERAALSHRAETGHHVSIVEAGAIEGGGDAVLDLGGADDPGALLS